MTAALIDGTAIAEQIRSDIALDAARFKAQYGFPPGLGVVLVGDDPASAQYVRMKRRACDKAGITSVAHVLPATAAQADVEAAVRELNADPAVHGILVQLPMPRQIDEEAVLRLVSIDKDVDGLSPLNIGLLAMKGRDPLFTPATPTGCIELLKRSKVNLDGANAVVIGRSNLVGMPVSLMLIKANATVTLCHSRTHNIAEIVRQADVVIAAIGKARFVKAEWIKPGAVVIDVGTNKIDDPSDSRGYRWVGDVDFEAAKEVAGAITEVPGGVGPMTIAMLLHNTMKAAWRLAEKRTP
ncbi:MAG TPA: bifunctional 5,10-methylenetetrahydrofolate dehydrogenase/5,10-methenyltetrahydrofolate cyclohydrolase [Phototrophicaceae bacterium]|nr:bifunctional 5,10-methylenetetrahydrofolate dehydrogenase/5,10-methenyltetrahydrofolate cyclohydrolase [Phototrophicaceae bacterium]